jgi:16S rRNA processing protein RimM
MLISDMIGLPVYHIETGEKLGEICDIDDTKAGRLYSIKTEGGVVLLPGVSEFVKEISEEGGMKVLPIPGFFDEGDEI